MKNWRHFLIQSEARSKSIVTRLRAFSRASCELCLHLLRVFLMIGQSGCVGLGFTTPIELPFHKPLFGIVLVNRHAPLLICSSGMNMIWSVYQLLRVANHNWNLANGLGCPCYTQLPFDCQIYDFLRGLNKNIWSLKRPSADPSSELSISCCLIIGKPALLQKWLQHNCYIHSSGQPRELLWQ